MFVADGTLIPVFLAILRASFYFSLKTGRVDEVRNYDILSILLMLRNFHAPGPLTSLNVSGWVHAEDGGSFLYYRRPENSAKERL
jgi:hypothetical protein